MCDPVSASILMVASGATQAIGQYKAGKAQKAASNYQSQVAENNRIYAENQAADSIKRGRKEETRHRMQIAQLKGAQIAAMAKNGVVVDAEDTSALDILGDTTEFGELDALTIRSNAEREAFGHKVQASNFAADSVLNRAQGKAAFQAGVTGAIGTLIGTAATTGFQFAKFKGSTAVPTDSTRKFTKTGSTGTGIPKYDWGK